MRHVALYLFMILGVAGSTHAQTSYIFNGPPQVSSLLSAGAGSDCGMVTSGQQSGIQCLTSTWPVSGTAAVLVSCNQIGGLIKASGGGTVPIVLPDAPCRGPGSTMQFSTDGMTSFTLTTQSSATTMDGLPHVNGKVPNPALVTPGGAAWAVFDGNHNYNVGLR